jgi:hypothetical protein
MNEIFTLDIKNEQSNLFNLIKFIPRDTRLVDIINIDCIPQDSAIKLFNALHFDSHLIRLTTNSAISLNFKSYIYDIVFNFISYDQMNDLELIVSNFNTIINIGLDSFILEYCDYLFDMHVQFVEIYYKDSNYLFSSISHDLKILMNRYRERLKLLNIPFCAFSPIPGEVRFDNTRTFRKAFGCLNCKHNDICLGIPDDYLNSHRDKLDIFPVKISVQDGDISEINKFKSKMRTIVNV